MYIAEETKIKTTQDTKQLQAMSHMATFSQAPWMKPKEKSEKNGMGMKFFI